MLKNNKRGLSAIIVTVLLIGLTIVAVGVVWAVINSTLKRGTESTDLGVKCLDVQVRATSVTCGETPAVCSVRLERTGTRDDVMSGVKIVFQNSSGSRSATPGTFTGNIEQLGNPTAQGINSGVTEPNRVETTVFFTDASGNTQYCSQPNIFTF